MMIGARNSRAGLFSHLNFVMTHVDELGHAGFHADWSEGNPYADGTRGNLFDALFVQDAKKGEDSPLIEEWPHHRYTGSNAATLYLGSFKWRWRLHHCWNLLQVRNELLQEVESYCGSWTKDATALHVRNRHIGTECPGGHAPTLDDYGRVLYGGAEPVFLATDNQEAVDYFKNLLGERLRTREIDRAGDMNTEYHLSHPQTDKDARECLIDALIMARCGRIIHSVSNIATAVLYINPRIPHVFVTKGNAVFLPPESKAEATRHVWSVIARKTPCRVIHLDHPRWKDWGLVFEDNVIARHSTGCAGALVELENGDIEVRWRDWDPEVFSPKPIDDARFAKAGLPLYYQFRRSRRIEIALQGGLGNQMFQYAFGLHVAKRLDAELVLSHDGGNRSFALGMFDLAKAASLGNSEVLDWEGNYESGIEDELITGILDSNPMEMRVRGWFQNENFFLPVAGEIRRCFDFRMPLPSVVSDRTPVAVHVRLGDYRYSAVHCPLPASYYESALLRLRAELENPLFLVFSDDPAGCPDCLRNQSDTVILPMLYDFHAFGMMRSCSAFVIANSTFSWWPAWLSGSAHVTCPEPFLPYKDWTICPEHWHHIPVIFDAKA